MLRRFALLTLAQVVVISCAGKGNGDKFKRSIRDGFRGYFKDYGHDNIVVTYDPRLENYTYSGLETLVVKYK
ncbi:unnamed protein product [Cylicocyclus nassatus]|uniref:Uncharacterized protein n=1 Tax=Cylicocyclus nassatus TaxID=53992 RepID=A0AA36DRZ5_CYLNA|nr:unnamed protein product [Cylicocyclus nassatus]